MTVRNYRLAFAGVCAVFAVAIVAEAAWMMPGNDASGTQRPIDAVAQVDKLALPGLDSDIATILERPLFSASREAVEKEEEDEDSDGDGAETIDSRLSGIVIGAGAREALFQHESEKPVSVKIGDKIAGWTVEAIETDHVELSRGDSTQTVSLLDDKNAPRAAARPKAQKKPLSAVRKQVVPRPAAQQRPNPGRQASR